MEENTTVLQDKLAMGSEDRMSENDILPDSSLDWAALHDTITESLGPYLEQQTAYLKVMAHIMYAQYMKTPHESSVEQIVMLLFNADRMQGTKNE